MDEQILNIKHKVKRYHCEVTKYNKGEQTALKHIENHQFGIFYKVQNYVVFTIIVDKAYPIKLAGAFIDAIISPFFDEVKTQFTAAHYESKLESLNTELYFIKFDRKIKEKKREFDDPNSVKNVDRMKRELENIHEIMKENMSLLEGRQSDLL
jgi:vesicle transport protein SEC22